MGILVWALRRNSKLSNQEKTDRIWKLTNVEAMGISSLQWGGQITNFQTMVTEYRNVEAMGITILQWRGQRWENGAGGGKRGSWSIKEYTSNDTANNIFSQASRWQLQTYKRWKDEKLKLMNVEAMGISILQWRGQRWENGARGGKRGSTLPKYSFKNTVPIIHFKEYNQDHHPSMTRPKVREWIFGRKERKLEHQGSAPPSNHSSHPRIHCQEYSSKNTLQRIQFREYRSINFLPKIHFQD